MNVSRLGDAKHEFKEGRQVWIGKWPACWLRADNVLATVTWEARMCFAN